MKFCRQYHDAIQELADGTLGPLRRAELQTHLDVCDDCRTLVEDLEKIRASAASLDSIAPPDHVWSSIANQLRKEGRAADAPSVRTWNAAMLAIAASLTLAVGASLYMLGTYEPARPASGTASIASDPQQGSPATGNAAANDTVQSITDDLDAIVERYESVIVKLEQAVNSNDGSIDPQAAAVVTKNLPVMNQAISETLSALKAEPQSVPARESLLQALRKKVNLLQDTIALMNEMRKGNSAGAAQLVDPGSKS